MENEIIGMFFNIIKEIKWILKVFYYIQNTNDIEVLLVNFKKISNGKSDV